MLNCVMLHVLQQFPWLIVDVNKNEYSSMRIVTCYQTSYNAFSNSCLNRETNEENQTTDLLMRAEA